MRTLTTTAAAFGIIAAILAGPAARPAQAEPLTGALILGRGRRRRLHRLRRQREHGRGPDGHRDQRRVDRHTGRRGSGGGLDEGGDRLDRREGAAVSGATVAVTPVLLTAGGIVVAGATVALTAYLIVNNWEKIVTVAEDAARATWNGMVTAATWTGEVTAAGAKAVWNGTVWTAELTADGGIAVWNGTKAAAGRTADITALGAAAAWEATKATGRWIAGIGRATAMAGGLLWDAITMQTPDPADFMPVLEPRMPIAGYSLAR